MRIRIGCKRFLSAALLNVVLVFAAQGEPAFPWATLVIENDTRDAEIQSYDDGLDKLEVSMINDSGDFPRKLSWSKKNLRDLLDANCPFGVLHYDPVKPASFTAAEKKILEEYFKRGGFIIFLEDWYPYEQEEYRKDRDPPIFHFLTQDLPRQNADFTTGRVVQTDPIFSAFYNTHVNSGLVREQRENPLFRNLTTLSCKKRMAAFFTGKYGYNTGERFEAIGRPFGKPYFPVKEGYQLRANLYFYAMSH